MTKVCVQPFHRHRIDETCRGKDGGSGHLFGGKPTQPFKRMGDFTWYYPCVKCGVAFAIGYPCKFTGDENGTKAA